MKFDLRTVPGADTACLKKMEEAPESQFSEKAGLGSELNTINNYRAVCCSKRGSAPPITH